MKGITYNILHNLKEDFDVMSEPTQIHEMLNHTSPMAAFVQHDSKSWFVILENIDDKRYLFRISRFIKISDFTHKTLEI